MTPLQRLLNPYWTPTPLKCHWSNAKGPAGFLSTDHDMQKFPDVGLFNLAWLLLDNTYGNERTGIDKLIMNSVIFNLQNTVCGNGKTLTELAAMLELSEFYDYIKDRDFYSKEMLVSACKRKLGLVHGLNRT